MTADTIADMAADMDADTDADTKKFWTADTDADTDMVRLRTADADTDMILLKSTNLYKLYSFFGYFPQFSLLLITIGMMKLSISCDIASLNLSEINKKRF